MSIYNPNKALPYCTYITFYRGKNLPPFYIGYSLTDKVKEGKYHGTPTSKDYCTTWNKEVKLNPHLFTTKILTTHATRQEAVKKEIYFQMAFSVHSNPMFVNRAIGSATGVTIFYTEERNATISRKLKGDKHPQFGKVWITNGKENLLQSKEEDIPHGWIKGRVNPGFGKLTREAIEKGATKRKGQISPMKGRKMSEESKTKIRLAKNTPVLSNCPHCQKLIDPQNLKRWHGENCKLYPN